MHQINVLKNQINATLRLITEFKIKSYVDQLIQLENQLELLEKANIPSPVQPTLKIKLNSMAFSNALASLAKTGAKEVNLVVADNQLNLTCKDSQISLSKKIQINNPTRVQAQVTVWLNLLNKFVKLLPDEEVSITFNEKLIIEYGYKGKFSFGLLEDKELINTESKYTQQAIVNSPDFITVLKQASKFVSKDTSQISLTGIHVRADKLNSVVVGSNGHFIGKFSTVMLGDKTEFIVSPDIVKYLPESGLLTLHIDQENNLIKFCLPDGTTVVQNLINNINNLSNINNLDSFDWKVSNNIMLVDKQPLLKELEILSKFQEFCFLTTKNGQILIETENTENFVTACNIGNTEDVSTTVNIKYLVNALKSIPTPKKTKKAKTNYDISISWEHLTSGLITISSNTKDKIILGICPITPIDDNKVVTINKFGFHTPCTLPYEYKNNCLTVTENSNGYLRAEYLRD